MRLRTGALLVACCALCGVAGMPSSAHAQTARESRSIKSGDGVNSAPSVVANANIDPEALSAVQRMAAAHAALQGYSARGEIRVKSGSAATQSGTFSLMWQRPGRARAESSFTDGSGAVNQLLVSDGEWLYVGDSRSGSWNRSRVADSKVPSGVELVLRQMAPASGVLRILTLESGAAKQLIPSYAKSLVLLPDETLDGVLCQTVKMVIPGSGSTESSATYAMGKSDSLLRRVVLQYTANKSETLVEEFYRSVTANPAVPAGTFTFTPPAGMLEQKSGLNQLSPESVKKLQVPNPSAGGKRP